MYDVGQCQTSWAQSVLVISTFQPRRGRALWQVQHSTQSQPCMKLRSLCKPTNEGNFRRAMKAKQ